MDKKEEQKQNFLTQLTELSKEEINEIIETKGKPIRLMPGVIFNYQKLGQ